MSAQPIHLKSILIISTLKNCISLCKKKSLDLGNVKAIIQTYLARAQFADWLIMDSAVL
jgi:hypothetical protein